MSGGDTRIQAGGSAGAGRGLGPGCPGGHEFQKGRVHCTARVPALGVTVTVTVSVPALGVTVTAHVCLPWETQWDF